MCTIMIVLLALCQPYKRKVFNYVDILVFTNLIPECLITWVSGMGGEKVGKN